VEQNRKRVESSGDQHSDPIGIVDQISDSGAERSLEGRTLGRPIFDTRDPFNSLPGARRDELAEECRWREQ
jgi:hypothetical protein